MVSELKFGNEELRDGRAAFTSARIAAVSTFLPEKILGNDELAGIFETWTADKIAEKTGIVERRIAADDETAVDLGEQAALRLFSDHMVERQSVDFLIFCSQAPDYILPSSACILQHRLGLPKSTGALDVNLGCSGFVYCLSLASGLIAGGMARRVLIITADTYSKFIHPLDRSVRTLFGDGASATLVECASPGSGAEIGAFAFGTDGAGAGDLMVETGGARVGRSEASGLASEDEFGNVRARDNLYMNGSGVMSFTLREVPPLFRKVKESAGCDDEGVDFVVLHQANQFMLDALSKKMKLDPQKVPRFFSSIGNTVSSTIPFVLESLSGSDGLPIGKTIILLGFGVGLSWAGCAIKT